MRSTQTQAVNQAASITQMPRDVMKRAAALAKGGSWTPPYPWDVPPPGHVAREIRGDVLAPPYNTPTTNNQVEIVSYTVPAGLWFVLKRVLVRYDGQSFIQGSGDIVFQVDINNPLVANPASSLTVGRALPDFGQVLTNLGSFDFGGWPIPGSPIFYAGERIGVKGYTVQNVGTGAGNFFHAILQGWEWAIAS